MYKCALANVAQHVYIYGYITCKHVTRICSKCDNVYLLKKILFLLEITSLASDVST